MVPTRQILGVFKMKTIIIYFQVLFIKSSVRFNTEMYVNCILSGLPLLDKMTACGLFWVRAKFRSNSGLVRVVFKELLVYIDLKHRNRL
ncbi:hypothetical protein F4818DRAFT_429583 [Hypoxylon cercidicola]|nr:hypothetical protein F4818DRAFT_429583 [Hypoxylon cercidicola]